VRPIEKNAKGWYQPWTEDSFRADVRHLTAIQSWMYRSLLQAAFVESTRPHLPDDDSKLWVMAGCQDRKQWIKNKDAVREMFTPIEIDGQKLLSRGRLIKDWTRLQDKREYLRELGSKGGKRAHAKKKSEPESSRTAVKDIDKERERVIVTTLERTLESPSLESMTSAKAKMEQKLIQKLFEVCVETKPQSAMSFGPKHQESLREVIAELLAASFSEADLMRTTRTIMESTDDFEAGQAGARLPMALKATLLSARKHEQELATVLEGAREQTEAERIKIATDDAALVRAEEQAKNAEFSF
jgi:hypothetical protein